MQYAELFCQSNFSFLKGASHPEELMRQAHFLGYRALAITDECSVAGVVRAYTEQRDQQLAVQLIVGSLLCMDDLQCVVLCPDRQAYTELCRVITQARRRADKGSYRLDLWDWRTLRHCFLLWLPSLQPERDAHWGRWLSQHHRQRLWIGFTRWLDGHDAQRQRAVEALSAHWDLPVCACGGVLFHHPERQPLQHIMTAISHKQPVDQLGEALITNTERSLRSREKLATLFPDRWLQASVDIARRCQFSLDELRYEYPAELIPPGHTPRSYLRTLVEAGVQQRFPEGLTQNIRDIIEKELRLIHEQNYEYFFLTIHDIVQFAKSQHILYQGRGSAANSVVCYCLEITAVDPRQINVLFERFISKERNEPPDIDVDFEHERREEVIQYIYRKYGRERTALAATVICYRFKSALRDVGKALGLAETQLDYFIKHINRRDRGLDWQTQITELGLDPDSHRGLQFIQRVNELMGFPRHLSQHVGGFVISAGPLYHLVPVENAAMPERTVIQWDKDDLESLGLLKVDVLALGMLTAIRKAFDLIEQHQQRVLQIADITRQDDDPDVYAMIQRADTVGVFQIESRAQMSMLPRLKPACYYDLVVQIAIVRPGPIQGDMVHPYLKRRDGLEAVEYPSKDVEQVLSRTMGVPIFQEQVIQLAMVAAGFSGGEADQLRRAMASWKKNGQLMQFKHKLIDGMRQRGYSEAFAERLFNQILGFGEYGFPESHSASFAVLAYVSSWLKCHYPVAFYVALLNSWPMGFYAPAQLIQDARRHDITVLPVCVNQSDWDHQWVEHEQQQAIRLGLRLVKGVSESAMKQLTVQRPKVGFKDVAQLQQVGLSREQLEALASANALHTVHDNRYAARWALMDTTSTLPLFKQQHQLFLFDNAPEPMADMLEDYAATTVSLKHHPIRLLREQGMLPKHICASTLHQHPAQTVVTVCGMVIGRQAPGTAGGVTFVTLEDDTGNINVIVWKATARAQKQAFLNSRLLMVRGILERGDGGVTHIVAGKLERLDHLADGLAGKSRDFH
ncbi:error-prone DNA polymerase [Aestuariibacter halophilus]|uniref:Error-prone DNA polymerase n=1 Tax=Fluctibacter halophilus TaxID=226011 RepID=A0ABS8GAR6_9ALTE|nr:error-prone DNA polymerase [Aestuariibacter halophilus]MCC2617493.1 error-prone DNA polymerase [Aestuariibacter halophilus]